ncbi:alkylation response protein AidB-like acyl-CoA dehydrogenase [Nocardioides daedukensis]|uniref:Alkylation response protein AidB-like acyl-CoA dehydrogenase n=1 Tax=Nocardioides daedukensis TaxID=634462 RepID=A0A7Y9UPK2_9ACTN|nr:acyl-CoA dehydrogenase [Nocardioides daedukensis]NYG57596.1 alkylation response protein AidB-like acyl-CoA dehydrogenase [Nocardioides daedukensis]
MSLGISDDHRELGSSVRKWAASLAPLDDVRAAEERVDEPFERTWQAVAEMGITSIAVPETDGGGDGSPLELAIALEACAHELVPGGLLGTSVAALVAPPIAGAVSDGSARVGLGLTGSLRSEGGNLTGTVDVVWDAPGATHHLLGDTDDQWYVVPAAAVSASPSSGPDLTRRFGSVTVSVLLSEATPVPGLNSAKVREAAVALAAAEASGIARWSLETAVAYAGVREQFGKPIGSFQAIKHLCAEMLEVAEAVTAVAWDAANAFGTSQSAYAADVAGAVAFDGAVKLAHDCIQVLGGIGFTFEHDAHFYLRRATTLRNLLGSSDSFATSLAGRAVAGERRKVEIDFDGADAAVRDQVRPIVASIADLDDGGRRAALVESGLFMPHWPAPYGRDASALEQLVIDDELSSAGVSRPDIRIGAWAVPTILAHGTEEQREQFVAPTLRGEITWCQLFSEPGAGSDLASLRTRATRTEGGWLLTGQKVWTSLAREADWGICLARTDPDAPSHKGITYFLLDMRAEGIDIRPLREMTGDALFNEVFLEDVFVPDSQVVGEPGGGWKLARTTLANERVAMAGAKLDVSVERAVALCGDRPETHPRTGHAVALATVCGLLATRSTLRSLEGQGPGAESSVSKLLGVRNRQDASELVVELLGDRVVLGGPEVEAAVHEALLTRCLSIAGGTTQVLRNVAAERILGLPR